MIRWWRRRSVRARLTLWYALVLGAVLLLYVVGVVAFLNHRLVAELDRSLYDAFEVAEKALVRSQDGSVDRPVAPHHYDAEKEAEELRLEVWGLDGKLLHEEGPEALRLPPPDDPASVEFKAVTSSVELAGGFQLRVRTGRHVLEGTAVLLRVARSEARLRHELNEFLLVMALGLPVAVALAGLGGYFVAGRALAPVGQMAERARNITADRLSERLPIENPDDEFGRLGTVFNETLARLERSFDALQKFTADAAHELRTPLTALRSVGEVGLRESRDDHAYREVIGSMLEETDRLSRLVQTLLTLSRAEGRRAALKRERIDLCKLAREVSEHLGVLAEERGQSIEVEAAKPVYALADGIVLRQAVINLLDNAIKYSPREARIRLVVAERAGRPLLEVIDTGPGIPSQHRARVFDRFYRIDKARSRETGGTGLGLAIAEWAVKSNGGTIELECGESGGSTFRIVLPPIEKLEQGDKS